MEKTNNMNRVPTTAKYPIKTIILPYNQDFIILLTFNFYCFRLNQTRIRNYKMATSSILYTYSSSTFVFENKFQKSISKQVTAANFNMLLCTTRMMTVSYLMVLSKSAVGDHKGLLSNKRTK
jgi:hypothetical protein